MSFQLLLCLALTVPFLANAQAGEAPVASQEAALAPPAAAPGEVFPRELEGEVDGSGLMGGRILTGFLLGTLTGAGGSVLGLLASLELSNCDVFDRVCSGGTLFGMSVPVVLSTGLASSLAVYGMARLFDGQGGFPAPLLGAVVGSSLGMLLAFVVDSYGAFLAVPPLAAMGAVVSHELFHARAAAAQVRARAGGAGLQLTPLVGRTRAGGVLGMLAGRF